MNKCFYCGSEYEAQRSTSKFCSNKCRSANLRANLKKGKEEEIGEIKRLLNEFKEVMQEIKKMPPQIVYDGPRFPANFQGDEPLSFSRLVAEIGYNEAQELICAATSSSDLQKAWKRINERKDWPSWQLKELDKLKENQRTKIDF